MTAHERLRVLHVCAPARSGGLETVVQLLTTGLKRRGHGVEVAVVLSPADAFEHPLVIGLQADHQRVLECIGRRSDCRPPMSRYT